jgi:hypothetical protein
MLPTRNPDTAHPAMNSRVVAAVAAFILGVVLVFLTLIVLALSGTREKTLIALGSSFAAPMAGLLIVGWKKPEMFLAPLRGLWFWLNARLSNPTQRILFLLSLVATIPWIAFRVVGEAFETSTLAEYARGAYYPLANTVFSLGGWGYEPRWYDWTMLLALVAFTLAIFWRTLGGPLVKWIRGAEDQ